MSILDSIDVHADYFIAYPPANYSAVTSGAIVKDILRNSPRPADFIVTKL